MELLEKTVFHKFKKRSAIKFYDSHSNLTEFNYGQLWNAMQTIAEVLQGQQIEGQLIGVQLFHCPALIAVLGGITISGNGFYCIDLHAEHTSLLTQFKECAAFFLADRGSYLPCHELQLLVGLRVLSTHIALAVGSRNRHSNREIAFCVRTSGSTGSPKTILVPKSCIMPNILSLSERFKLSEFDVVFVCSPPTFDPFVVDVLLGLRAGATLLLVDNEIRLSASRLVNVLFPGVTFMQMTPSMFTRWAKEDMIDTILASHSTLRLLVLGGEKFPLLPIPLDSRTDVYNIYGITEISCWSTMQKVTQENRDDVPLGSPLDESIILQLRSTDNDQQLAGKSEDGSTLGQLYIGSVTRKCIVTGDSHEAVADLASKDALFRSTGDLVELSKDNKYFYRGRCERTIKRFGCRVSLPELEETLLSHEAVEQCASCVIGEDDRVVMFFKSSNEHHLLEDAVWKHLRAKLSSQKLPDAVYRTEQFPLSDHGKISDACLVTLYQQLKAQQTSKNLPAIELFRTELVAIGILHHLEPDDGDSKKRKLGSFIDHGGTSIAALRMHATMEKVFGVPLPDLLSCLLDPRVSLDEALRCIELNPQLSSDASSICLQKNAPVDPVGEGMLTIACRYDMGKCIDARPTVTFCHNLGHILCIGSHSGLLLTIDVETNSTVSRLTLPDRIECAVSFLTLDNKTKLGVVGCYDGYLYCFNPLNGAIVWRYDADGMVKCCPLVVPDTNIIIFGSYSTTHNLHCLLGNDNGAVRWRLKLGTKPILAQPIALDEERSGCVFVATLDGTIASISLVTGCIAWSSVPCGNVPIFGTPVYFSNHGRIVLCRVDGTLSVYESGTGKQTATATLPGNVFSSFEIWKQSDDKVTLLVGCYDRHVHCVEYLPKQCGDTLVLKWKVQMQSQIYATPLVVGRHLFVCTTSGYINLVDLEDEHSDDRSLPFAATLRMGGELFAGPVVYGNAVFVGCRDNVLYKILLNKTK